VTPSITILPATFLDVDTGSVVTRGASDITVNARAIDALIAQAAADRMGYRTSRIVRRDGSVLVRVTERLAIGGGL
jgi:chorismate-pyruvate lyase